MINVFEIARKKYKKGDIVELNGLRAVVTLTYLKWNTHLPHLFVDYYGGTNLYNKETDEWAEVVG